MAISLLIYVNIHSFNFFVVVEGTDGPSCDFDVVSANEPSDIGQSMVCECQWLQNTSVFL